MTQTALQTAPEGREVQPITPVQMLQIAVEQGADLDKLEKLMELQQRWEANEARKAFVAAKAAFRAEAPKIDKNKHVGFESRNGGASTDYYHATLDHIEDVVSPVLSQHDLTYSWEAEQVEGGMIRVSCVLTHVLGHSERVTLQASPDQSGNKNNIQAVGSTTTYLSRYTLLLALGLSTGDADDDGNGATATISRDQKAQLVTLMNDASVNTAKFLAHFQIDYLDDLPADRFNEAMRAVQARLDAARKAAK